MSSRRCGSSNWTGQAGSSSCTKSRPAKRDGGSTTRSPHFLTSREVDQQIVNAIFIGSIYALFAVGYTLVFGILDILNLAHSAVFMFGAALTYSLAINHGQSFWVAAVLAIAISALMGLVIEHVCL